MKLLNNLDLVKNELQNARMQNLAAAPATPVVGQMYFDTATNKFGMYYSAAWKYFSVEGHTHTISNITDWPAAVSMTEVGYLDGVTSALQTQLNAKAPLASPALTGTPTAPTAAPGTNTTQISTTAFVQAAIAALIDSSPGALDTLNELAAALGDDPNFASTITTALAGKQPLNAILTAIAGLTSSSPNGGYGYLVIDRLADGIKLSFPQGGTGIDATQFDVNNNPIISLTDVVAAGTYTKVTVNAQGRVTAGAALAAGDIPNFDWSKITSGKPTTLAGYGITDGIKRYSAAIGNGSLTSITVTHNLNSQNVTVAVRETASPYNIVYPDIQIATVNTVTCIFATAPTANQYQVTVIA